MIFGINNIGQTEAVYCWRNQFKFLGQVSLVLFIDDVVFSSLMFSFA